MKIEIDGSVVEEALRVLITLAPPLTGKVIVQGQRSGLRLLSIGEYSRCLLNIPAKVKGEDTFALMVDSFFAATRGRELLKLYYNNDVLSISSDTYRTQLATVEVIQEESDIPEVDAKAGFIMRQSQSEWIRDSLAKVFLGNDKELNISMHHISLQMDDDGACMCCFDSERMAYCVSPEVNGDINLVLPYNTISGIVSTFGSSNFRMLLDDGVVRVWNKIGLATSSIIDPRFSIPMEQLMARIEESRSKPLAVWNYKPADIKKFLSNAKAIANVQQKTSVNVKIGKKSALLLIKTPQGSSEIEIECESNTEASINLDMGYFEELLATKLETVFVHPTYIAAHDDDHGYIVALNQAE